MDPVRLDYGRFEATVESSREVRRFLSAALMRWGFEHLVGDASLCVAELATNAVLHAGSTYSVAVRALDAGVRVEVVDDRPELVPSAVPTTGTAAAITSRGTTGRGLQLVAALANSWGYTTSATAKTVWFEICEPGPLAPSQPVVVEGYHTQSDPAAPLFSLTSLPVRAAVASGIHVEELVREVHLANAVSAADIDRLTELLRLSAPARLLGRHAAYQAAAQDQTRFSVDVRLSQEVIGGFGALNEMLANASHRLGITIPPLPAEVTRFRQWLVEEIVRQRSGERPTTCPLPD
ncbi:MAG: hypothetical protein QOG30_2480 [Acidimicrobiaceae bacterium]